MNTRIGWVVTAAVMSCMPSPAYATPFVGEGRVASSTAGARARATTAAREDTLAQVLDSIEGADRSRLTYVRAHPEVWTGSYRVIEQRLDGTDVVVIVEVDLDVPRLAKWLIPAAPVTGTTFTLGDVTVDSCAEIDAAHAVVDHALHSAGATVPGGREVLEVFVRCRPRGLVPVTHLRADEVEVTVATSGSSTDHLLGVGSATGFAVHRADAERAGLADALRVVAREVAAAAREELTLHIRTRTEPQRVRRIIDALRSSVRGVTQASLSGVTARGVEVRATVDVTAQVIADRISALSFTDFTLTSRILSAHAIELELH